MPTTDQVFETGRKRGAFFKDLTSLPEYKGWSQDEVIANVAEVMKDDTRKAAFFTGLSKSLPRYNGWSPDEVSENLGSILTSPQTTKTAPAQPTRTMAEQEAKVSELPKSTDTSGARWDAAVKASEESKRNPPAFEMTQEVVSTAMRPEKVDMDDPAVRDLLTRTNAALPQTSIKENTPEFDARVRGLREFADKTSETIGGVLAPAKSIIDGGARVMNALPTLVKEGYDSKQGAEALADIFLGTASAAISSIPLVFGATAASGILSPAGREIGGGVGKKYFSNMNAGEARTYLLEAGYKDGELNSIPSERQKELAAGLKAADVTETAIHYATAVLGFGPKVAMWMAASEAGSGGVRKILDSAEWANDISSANKERLVEASGHAAFFGAMFGTKGATKLGKEALRGIVTKTVKETYTPEQLQTVWKRVDKGEGTPEEVQFVQSMNDLFGKPKELLTTGLTRTEQTTRNVPSWLKQFGEEGTQFKTGRGTAMEFRTEQGDPVSVEKLPQRQITETIEKVRGKIEAGEELTVAERNIVRQNPDLLETSPKTPVKAPTIEQGTPPEGQTPATPTSTPQSPKGLRGEAVGDIIEVGGINVRFDGEQSGLKQYTAQDGGELRGATFYVNVEKGQTLESKLEEKKQAFAPKARSWYRGTVKGNTSGDQFFSSSEDVAAEYGTPAVGEQPNIEQVSEEEILKDKKIREAVSKEDLGEELGIADRPDSKEFDQKVKAELQNQGFDGVRYENGTFSDMTEGGAQELHVFGNAKLPPAPPKAGEGKPTIIQRAKDLGLEISPEQQKAVLEGNEQATNFLNQRIEAKESANAEEQSWSDAFKESGKRLKDEGFTPDDLKGAARSQIFPAIDPTKVAFILEPVLNKAKVEAVKLMREGKLKAEEFAEYIRTKVREFIEANEQLKKLPPEQRELLINESNEFAKKVNLKQFAEAEALRETIGKLPESEIQKQRRGERSHETTVEAAKDQDKIVRDAIAGRIPRGTVVNAEQQYAIASEIAKRVEERQGTNTITPEDVNLIQSWLGVRAETGRALNAFQIPVDPKVAEFIRRINPNVKVPVRVPPGLMEKIAEFARNAKLASLSGLVRSVVGNTTMQLFKYPELVGEITGNKIRKAIMGESSDRTYRELAADWVGFKSGMREGFTTAWEVVKENQAAVERNVFLMEETGRPAGAIEGKKGVIIRTPQRLQGAIDAMLRIPTAKGLVGRYAARQAFNEGLKGEAWMKRVKNLTDNPTADLMARAATDARYFTLQAELGATGQEANALRLSHPVVQWIIPFFNTPANLFKALVERTPFAAMTPTMRQALMEAFTKPGTVPSPRVLRLSKATGVEWNPESGLIDKKMSRMLTGSAAMGLISFVIIRALDGEISGRAPKSPEERDALERVGWKPYSIRIGGKWIGYQGFEPLSGFLGVIADTAGDRGIDETRWSKFIHMATNLAANFAENPFLTGIKDVIDVVSDPESAKVERMLGAFAGGMVIPTVVKQSRYIFDQNMKKPSGIGEQVISQLPILNKDLQPRRNVFGEEILVESPGTRLLGVMTSTQKDNPVEKELLRLDITLGWPSDQIEGVKLTPQQYDRYIQVAGLNFKKALTLLMQSPAYKELTDGLKEKAIILAQTHIREAVRTQLFMEQKLEGMVDKAEKNVTGGTVSPEETESTMKALRRAIGK